MANSSRKQPGGKKTTIGLGTAAGELDDVVRYGFSASVWRHFERLDSFPRGLLPLGDAICCFNPVYGQGMSLAAQEALLLQRLLRSRKGDPLAGLAPAFFAEASGLIETPWASAAVPDLALSETEGQRPPDLERTLRFRRALNRLAAADPAVHQKVLEVQHLMKPRSVLLDPAAVSRRRRLVVPTAMIRPPSRRAAAMCSAVSAETTPHSACIW